jgi:PAS domain S-box-containing protein
MYTTLLLEGNKPVGVQGIAHDITERKRIEQSLQESRDQLDMIFSSVQAGIVIVDAETRKIVDANPAAVRMIELPREQIVGQVCHEFICPAERHACPIIDLGHHVDNSERVLLNASGHRIPIIKTVSHQVVDGRRQLIESFVDITERKKMEEELCASKERMSFLVSSSPAVIYTSKTSGDFGATFVSENVKTQLGYEPREFIEDSNFWVNHIHPEDRQRILDGLNALFREGHHIHEYRFQRKDGDYRWMHDRLRLIRDTSGNAVEIIGYWVDITERKQLEETLRASEEMHRAFFENSIDGALLTGPDGSIFAANSEACRIFQRTEEELRQVGRNGVVDLTDSRLQAGLEQRARTGRFRGELTLRRKDGTAFPADISTSVFKDRHGNERTRMIVRDITERKRAQEEIEKSSQLTGLLLDSLPHPAMLIRLRDRTLLAANKTALQMGAKKGEPCYLTFAKGLSVRGDEKKCWFCMADEAIAGKKEIVREVQALGRIWDMSWIPVENDTYLHLAIDATGRKQTEKMRDQFISAVTHELRTPLVPIKANVDFVLSGKLGLLPEKVKSSLQLVKSSTDRLASLTDELLDLRRLESGRFELSLADLDFRDVISQSVEEMQATIALKTQSLHAEVPDKPLPIRGDLVRLKQVLLNLLSNASKFTPENRSITVKVEDEADAVKVQVSDAGIGLKTEDLVRVFEPFSAIEKPTHIKGTGLGLSITKGLVEAHGGKIWAESAGEGKGATFTFTIPKEKEEAD